MPYRDRARVAEWVDEFLTENLRLRDRVSVLDDGFAPGPNSAIVIIELHHAPTLTMLQAFVADGHPRWRAVFEGRGEQVDATCSQVRDLADDFADISRLCTHLQARTDAHT